MADFLTDVNAAIAGFTVLALVVAHKPIVAVAVWLGKKLSSIVR